MKDLFPKKTAGPRPVKSENILRAQARKVEQEGWIFLEERGALIGKMVRSFRGNTLVTVCIGDSKKEHSTIIVGVDRDTGVYQLDQMDDSVHSQMQPGTSLKMYGFVDGVKSFWSGTVLDVKKGEEITSKSGKVMQSWVYEVSCPYEMSYIQRRESFRLAPGMHRTIEADFECFGEMVGVEVRDISLEGIGLWLFRDPINYGIAMGTSTPAVIRWDDWQANIEFFCIWIHQTREGAGWRLGGTFELVDSAQMRSLERLIRYGELELLRAKGD